MTRLNITGEYPPNWKEISDATWAAAGHRCIRCRHPYRKGEHGRGEWTPCDVKCCHGGPINWSKIAGAHQIVGSSDGPFPLINAGKSVFDGFKVVAQWRIGTVHHLDGNKANCRWWNLLALCQRCHLTIQSRVDPEQPYILEHTDWFKPYVAAFYAHKYEAREVTREQAERELDRLLALERIA